MIGRYEVVAKLGEGGMAEAWLCRMHGARGFSRRVLIKTLKAEHLSDPAHQAMFADEARLGAMLDHPNIPRIEELGEYAGVPFMVQEFVEGPGLSQLLKQQLRRGHLDLRLGARIALDIAQALHHAYNARDEQGRPLAAVHRDVSLSNILVSARGKAVLIDFGVARFDGRQSHTEVGILKGKLRYMAPETILHGVSSHQSDLFSLGVVLYLLCVGQHPWGPDASVSDRLSGQLEPPSRVRPDLPEALESIILRAMATDRARRYTSGAEMAQHLETWLAGVGPVGDAELAGHIDDLFPNGPGDWQTPQEINTRTFAVPAPGPPRWVPAVAFVSASSAIVGLCILALVTGALFVMALDRIWPPDTERVALEASREPASSLLQAAHVALDRGDLSETSVILSKISDLELQDPDLIGLHQRLQLRLSMEIQAQDISTLLSTDPGEALRRAQLFAAEFPEERSAQRILEEARSNSP
ncbi:MAG TPA: serine/threonine protein kinase [Deltaproteobacteria bacterium]|nr:serine/threonine protein kinase [Deltaproteobacteria bacterium]